MQEIRIESFADFCTQIAELQGRTTPFKGPISSVNFFRGQADESWELVPGLYRTSYVRDEQAVLNDATNLCPGELQQLPPLLRLMVVQHHGLPTRLLDVTTNPLVALYFGVAASYDRDGAVFFLGDQPTADRSIEHAELAADFAFNGDWTGVCLADYARAASARLPWLRDRHPGRVDEADLVRDVKDLLTAGVMAVLPPLFDERLKAQAGAFLVWHMRVQLEEASDNPGTTGKVYTTFTLPQDRPVSGLSGPMPTKMIIPAQLKQSLLAALTGMDVTQFRLFPGLDGAMGFLSGEYGAGRRGGFRGRVTS